MKMPFPSAEKAEIPPAFVENSSWNWHLHLLQYNILSMIIKKMSRLLVVSDDIFFTIFLTPSFLLYIFYIPPLNFVDKYIILAEFSAYSAFVKKG